MAVIFDSEYRRLVNDDNIVNLSRQQADCLILLMEAEGTLVSGEEIMRRCWTEKGVVVGDSSVRVALYQLRKQLAQSGLPDNVLVTEVGSGYRLRTGYLLPSGRSAKTQSENTPSPRDLSEPVKKAPGHRAGRAIQWLVFVLLLSGLTLGGGWLRLRALSTPVHYTPVSGAFNLHILAQDGVSVNAERVEHLYSTIVGSAPEQFSSPWIYVHRSLHESNLTALVCDRNITDPGRVCYSLHYEEER